MVEALRCRRRELGADFGVEAGLGGALRFAGDSGWGSHGASLVTAGTEEHVLWSRRFAVDGGNWGRILGLRWASVGHFASLVMVTEGARRGEDQYLPRIFSEFHTDIKRDFETFRSTWIGCIEKYHREYLAGRLGFLEQRFERYRESFNNGSLTGAVGSELISRLIEVESTDRPSPASK